MTDSWNSKEVISAWQKERSERALLMGQATELMLKAAKVKSGDFVLDIAAGMGEQSIAAAKIVGEEGSIMATDISENMLVMAMRMARESGLENIRTRVMNAEEIDFPAETFDSAISRHGLMFIPDLSRALRGVIRVLKREGAFAALVWSHPDRNPAIAIPMTVLCRIAGLPTPKPGNPGLFSLGDAEILSDSLREAGFQDVKVQPIPHLHRAPSLQDFLRTRKEMAYGTMGEAVKRLSEEDRARAQAEIVKSLGSFEKSGCFEIPGESLLVSGKKQ